MSIDLEIKTPTGYQKFDGVKRYWHDSFLRITFKDDTYIDVAKKHKFVGKNFSTTEVVYAEDLKPGQYLMGRSFITSINEIHNGDWFYDPINVANGSIYYHDGYMISHNTFYGTGDTLIDANTLMALKARPPLKTIGDVKIYDEVKEGHEYIMTVDVAKGRSQDYSTFNIIDVTTKPFKQVAVYRNNKIPPLLFPNEIYKWATAYNQAYTIIESNDQGAVVCNGLYHELEYENMHIESAIKANNLGVEMTKKVKRLGCSGLKSLLEAGGLEIVDHETIEELNTFEAKGTSFEASDGNHDDLVMNLVMLGYFSYTKFFSNLTDIKLREFLYEQRIKEIEDDVVPFGFIHTAADAEMEELDMTGGPEWSLVKDPFFQLEEIDISGLMQ